MRPFGIPLTWQPWPSAGPCTPLAPETIAHSYLQGPVHKLILKTVVPTVSSLRGYCYTCLSKISYPYIFGILVRRSGKPSLSSSDVCISRIESIKCLFGKDAIAKYGASAPVIHGTLNFGICGGEHIRILCRRTIRCRPRVGLLSRSRFWNPAGRGVTGRISVYSPANPLSARTRRAPSVSKPADLG